MFRGRGATSLSDYVTSYDVYYVKYPALKKTELASYEHSLAHEQSCKLGVLL